MTTLNLHYTRPSLYPKQQGAVFDPARYSIIEASTKSGKTIGCMCWLIELALQASDGQNFWWVSPIYAQAKVVFRRAKRALPSQLYKANESELTITLFNGAVMWFKGANDPDSLYGEDVYAAVIDEATRCKEESWFAVRSTLTATRGPIRIIGNVKGRRNWAYRLARRAESDPSATMAYHKITAQDAVDAGVLSADEISDAEYILPGAVYRELYWAEASDDQGNPFGITSIAECAIAGLSEDDPVIWGIDLAKSIDWTVCIGLDYRGHVCRFERFQKSWEETFSIITRLVGRIPAKADATGVGDPVVERLQRASSGYIEAFKFSPSSKQQIMEGLAVAIQSHDIGIPESSIIIAELEEFEYEYTRTGVRYTAPPGFHDDCVDALALAVSGLQLGRTGIGIYL